MPSKRKAAEQAAPSATNKKSRRKISAVGEDGADDEASRARPSADSSVADIASPSMQGTETDEDIKSHASLARQHRKFVGAHISAAGGVANAPKNSHDIAGQAFAFFLRPKMSWAAKPLTMKDTEGFKAACLDYNYDVSKMVLPHAMYLINLANPDTAKRQNMYKVFLDELRRCEALGVYLYNFHPGSTVGACEREEGIANIATMMNQAIEETEFVKLVVENMSGQKNVIGSRFQDLADIMGRIKNTRRVGICLDTCHMFAAGYDLRTEESYNNVIEEFDRIVGLKYLSAMHLNDSRDGLGSGRDRHANIGRGNIGLDCFKFIMRDVRLVDIPMVLETPGETKEWKEEIKLLYSFVKD